MSIEYADYWRRTFMKIPMMIALTLLMLMGCESTQKASDKPKGEAVRILEGQPGEVILLVFGSPDCPISNALSPEYQRLDEQIRERGGRFYLVHARPDVTMAMAKKHASDYRLGMPILLDPDHELVEAMDATVTPEAVVLVLEGDGKYRKIYQGQVNNLYASLGNRRDHATEFWARDAIDASFDGGQVAVAYRKPIGCYIEQQR